MRGLTQSQLADALQITFQQIQKYERAKNRISASRLIDVARVLDVDISELLPETSPQIIQDKPILSRQAAQLLQAFETILDHKQRGTILSLVKKLAQQDAEQRPDDTRLSHPRRGSLRPSAAETNSSPAHRS